MCVVDSLDHKDEGCLTDTRCNGLQRGLLALDLVKRMHCPVLCQPLHQKIDIRHIATPTGVLNIPEINDVFHARRNNVMRLVVVQRCLVGTNPILTFSLIRIGTIL
ncbi:hypothetical protein D3C77_540170 [compost metagenome]